MDVHSFEVLNDDPRLQHLLDFAARHGRPRETTAEAYRALVSPPDAVAARAFFNVDGRDEPQAAALATVAPAIGLDQVQLNAFLAPGAQDAFECTLDAVLAWARSRDAIHVTAHVSEPSDADLQAWLAAGFEQVGERSRVVRAISRDDVDLPTPDVTGVDIVALGERPDLEPGAEELWRTAHEDVPSALRFHSADLPRLRVELGIDEGGAWPPTVLVAVDEGGNVVGLVVGIGAATDRTELRHRMTATHRTARGRGVARALKVELLRRAATAGMRRAVASNDSDNAPMRAINESLGYEVEYRLVLLRRAID